MSLQLPPPENTFVMAQAPLLLDVDQAAIEGIEPDDQAAVEELGPDTSLQQSDDNQAATEELEPDAQQDIDQAALQEREALYWFYLPLYDAASSGDWENAKRFFTENPEADITQPNLNGMTILHIAANMGHAVFIKKLVRSGLFPNAAMKLLDEYGWTALHYAAAFGSLDAVKVLVSEDNSLTQLLDKVGCTPLYRATKYAASKNLIWYLINKTTNDGPPAGCGFGPGAFTGDQGASLINALVDLYYFDICLYLFNRYPQLANDSVDYWQNGPDYDLLRSLVRLPTFPSGSKLTFWERCIYHLIPIETTSSIRSDLGGPQQQQASTIRSKSATVLQWIFGAVWEVILYVPSLKHIRDVKYNHKCIIEVLEVACKAMWRWDVNGIITYFENRPAHIVAAKHGRIEVIKALIKHFPCFMDNIYSVKTDIILCAVVNREEGVFNLMMERGIFVKFMKMYVNEEAKENFLHVAAKLAPYTRLTSVSSPALQMQRELQWFQGVEKFVRPIMRTNITAEGLTARELFTTEHKDLVKAAEAWMKDTANSCLVVATLIITVVFAAAFTIPGGNIDGTGIPLFLGHSDFLVFVISDAVGMFSSATSILMFLSILTARYAEDDFLRALPKRLILGLVSLLIALASMMVAFGAALYLVLSTRFNWVIFPIVGITCIPVTLFILLQLPLFIYMVRSTYGPNILKDKMTSSK